MSYCINPWCLRPNDPNNTQTDLCARCGSQLRLQNRYRVTRVLSESSGFAVIYEISDGQILQTLKVLKPKHNGNLRAVELFKQEARVLSQLDHPGIPKVEPNSLFEYYPRDKSEPLHCFVMEKIEGLNLKEWMNQQGNLLIGESRALNWLKQVAEILQVVHQQNYFHRDIKLQNLMLRPNGQLVLIDFGTVRSMAELPFPEVGSSGRVTKISSAGYTPPEQEKGYAVPQSDFYALGRTFVYLLTGKSLYNRVENSPIDEFQWRELAADISPQFADFIDCLMAPEPRDRPQDAREIIETVERLQQQSRGNPPDNGRRIRLGDVEMSPDSPTDVTQDCDRASLIEKLYGIRNSEFGIRNWFYRQVKTFRHWMCSFSFWIPY
ncbi:MAG: serine/threonine-protein kinase [Cyanobacteriota bacterium]|nr:serine/threonine-protein kinase [Cyanobacteriota bacterium]